MRVNKLRGLLGNDQPSVATHIHSTWPSVVEVLGHTGFYDYVEFVAEYAPFDLHDLDHLCRAAELHDLGTMIKVDQEPRAFLAQRAIGSGFQSVLFADCRSAEEVRQCVRAVRPDTPQDDGTYGANMRRFAYMGYGGGADYVQALRDIVVVVMIEKRGAVEQLEEILSLPGVDMIQWGPADYTMSIGRAGERGLPEVKAVERRVIETALKMGVPPRAEIGSVDQAKYYLDLGVRHFCIGTDIGILFDWWKRNGDQMRQVLAEA
jgi:2-keto-3-deoxy-L-rhamnonate aldolase RhmA